ncbi:MAG: ABC transporter ATP-binding protein [Pirellulaceae bacterium]|nr:ABC transporter ATP-binding protein [Pirellulaceae bacterium]
MSPHSLRSLVQQIPVSHWRYPAALLNCVIGLSVPVLAVLAGYIVQALIQQPFAAFTARLPHVTWLLGELSPMARVSWLLLAALAVVVVSQVLLFVIYRLSQRAAVDFEIAMIDRLRQHARRLAKVRTLSAQQTSLQDCLEYHLPRVRNVLSMHWRSMPRHPVQCTAGLLTAGLIHPQFTFLAVVTAVLVLLVYQFLDRLRRSHLPVIREKAAQHRTALVNLSLRGPLLEAVHSQPEIESKVAERLELYRRDALRSLTSSAWKVPLLFLGLTCLACLLLFVTSIQVLRETLQLPAVVAFLGCLIGAVYSARRIMQVTRDNSHIATAADELNRFLGLVVPGFDDATFPRIDAVRSRAELEHVTVQDSRGRKLLEDVSVVFEPGQLIGIAAHQWLEGRALAELLIGLGRPTSGRMLVDGTLVSDLQSDCLIRCAHWVASDGGVLTGSVAENLRASSQPAFENAVRQAHLTDLMIRMSEGPSTLITHDDDRFVGDDAFRMGIARALLKNASVVVIEEPDSGADPAVQQATLQAISSLVDARRITVVLPQRLNTLRQCDRVIFVYEHRVLAVGSHADLIQKNDLYRHLTYLRYNPFQTGGPS